MATGIFYFFDKLMVFLPDNVVDGCVNINFKGHETVKHIIEAIGVPHTEVDVILVNEVSVGFDYRPTDGDIIRVFPRNGDWDERKIQHLQPEPGQNLKFILDGHLGKLASYLRILGFDTRYQNNLDDDVLADISHKEERILLTRDRGLLKRSIVEYGYYIREKTPKKQVVEVLNTFNLHENAEPFSRCAKCNGLLRSTTKEEVFDRLEPRTQLYYEDFKICSQCDQVYWKGSHFRKMNIFVNGLLARKDS
jgi:uncharacterized protein with PIN domain